MKLKQKALTEDIEITFPLPSNLQHCKKLTTSSFHKIEIVS